MQLKAYQNMSIVTIVATPNPGTLVRAACDLTMKKDCGDFTRNASQKLLQYLLQAEHTSVLEHCSITVKISGVSRSFLAQITRHRMATITSASQHYADYRDMPNIVHVDMLNDVTREALNASMCGYEELVAYGFPKEEARQVLPNAAEVQLLWTVNARSLINFLRLRMCRRNVEEMQLFAEKMWCAAVLWWPELFELVGPPCCMYPNKCNQGPMRSPLCKEK